VDVGMSFLQEGMSSGRTFLLRHHHLLLFHHLALVFMTLMISDLKITMSVSHSSNRKGILHIKRSAIVSKIYFLPSAKIGG
jgi:hypothetical protein